MGDDGANYFAGYMILLAVLAGIALLIVIWAVREVRASIDRAYERRKRERASFLKEYGLEE